MKKMRVIFLLLFCMFIMIIIGCDDTDTTVGETTTTIATIYDSTTTTIYNNTTTTINDTTTTTIYNNTTTTIISTTTTTIDKTTFTAVSASGIHNLAIDWQGQLWAWGRNEYGQLGDGTSGSGNYNPTPQKIKF